MKQKIRLFLWTSKRTSKTISVSEHFKKWEDMDKMYEYLLTVEGYQNSRSANVTSNTITIGGNNGTRNQEIELVVTADDGTWDAYINYLEID